MQIYYDIIWDSKDYEYEMCCIKSLTTKMSCFMRDERGWEEDHADVDMIESRVVTCLQG